MKERNVTSIDLPYRHIHGRSYDPDLPGQHPVQNIPQDNSAEAALAVLRTAIPLQFASPTSTVGDI